MVFARTKWIKGKPYQYLQASQRVGNKVRSIHVMYLGSGSGGGGGGGPATKSQSQPSPKKRLGTTSEEQLTKNVVYGSLHDKRPNKTIARDITRNAKTIHDQPQQWEKTGKDKSDLAGWDTTHTQKTREQFINAHQTTKNKLQKTFPQQQYEGRVKTLPSMVKKLKKKNVNETFVQKDFEDISGMRITFKNTPELKENIQKMRQNFNIKEEEDYITQPKGAGYRSYHFTVIEDGKPIEVQFRTRNQTIWAEWTHDRLYDNVDETQKRLGPKGFGQAQEYAKKMASYYARLDNGLKAEKPKTPQIVKEELGGGMQ